MRKYWAFCLFLPPLSLALNVDAAPACAATIRELHALVDDSSFPLKWYETTMDDGRPLVVSIFEKGGTLHLQFVKTGEGLWAESAGVICRKDANLVTSFTGEQIQLGPAAGWVTRVALASGGQFALARMGAEGLQITTSGWSGTFSSRASTK